MAARKRQPRGFSVFELVLALLVMTILVGLVLTSANAGLHDSLMSAAQILAGDIQYARNLAVVNGDTYRITFDTVLDQYVLSYSGTNTALATLPPSPFHTSSDTPTQQVVQLTNLPHVGPPAQLEAAFAQGNTSTQVTNVEFGPLGETTQTADTIIWLSAGAGAAMRHISVHVNAVTGLSTIENFQAQSPFATVTATSSTTSTTTH